MIIITMQANVGKQKEFCEALQKLRGKGIDTSEEALDIQVRSGNWII